MDKDNVISYENPKCWRYTFFDSALVQHPYHKSEIGSTTATIPHSTEGCLTCQGMNMHDIQTLVSVLSSDGAD